MALSKEKTWHVYDRVALDAAWYDYTVRELIEKIKAGSLLDEKLGKEARKLSRGIDLVRWMGVSYLSTYKSRKESVEVQRDLDRDLVEGLVAIQETAEAELSLWQFYSSRKFYERWFSTLPDEISVDHALLCHLTYTGVRFQEESFHGILIGPCKEKNLLRRNIVSPNVMEVPPLEEIGYDPDFEDAVLTVTESYLKDRITREAHSDTAWELTQALQRSIQFSREHELAVYITGDKELSIAPDLDFALRKEAHRGAPPRPPIGASE